MSFIHYLQKETFKIYENWRNIRLALNLGILQVSSEWVLHKTAITHIISKFFYLSYQGFLFELSLKKRPFNGEDWVIGLFPGFSSGLI